MFVKRFFNILKFRNKESNNTVSKLELDKTKMILQHNDSLEFEKVNEIVSEKEQKQSVFDKLLKEQRLREKRKIINWKINLLKNLI